MTFFFESLVPRRGRFPTGPAHKVALLKFFHKAAKHEGVSRMNLDFLKWPAVTIAVSLGVMLNTGCTTKKGAELKAREAYVAGQQQAMSQGQQQAVGNTIRINGDVKTPVLEWTQGFMLSEALVEAEYQNRRDPLAIVIFRQGQVINVNPRELLRGRDVPLQPGDRIDIQR
jgi:hypothetical protein